MDRPFKVGDYVRIIAPHSAIQKHYNKLKFTEKGKMLLSKDEIAAQIGIIKNNESGELRIAPIIHGVLADWTIGCYDNEITLV